MPEELTLPVIVSVTYGTKIATPPAARLLSAGTDFHNPTVHSHGGNHSVFDGRENPGVASNLRSR